jgi:hypothetical protein
MSTNTFNTEHTSHHTIDAGSLALSASRVRAAVLYDDNQFSRASEDHLIEYTRFDPTTGLTPTTHNFTSESQLSQYFCTSAPTASHQTASVEI